MKETQKGFAIVGVLLSGLILATLIFIGYKAWQDRPAKSNSIRPASSQVSKSFAPNSASSMVTGTEDWKFFSANGQGFNYSLRLPQGWNAETLGCDSNCEGAGNGISITNSKDKSAGFVFSAVLDPHFYQDQLQSEDLNYAWGLFKSQGLKPVVEANRQTTIEGLAANRYIADKTVGPLEQIAITEGEAWGYSVDSAYGTGFKTDLVSGSTVEKPSTVIFISNGKIVMRGVIITDDATQTKIVETIKIW